MPLVDAADHEEIAGRLHGLLIRLADRIPRKDQVVVVEYLDAFEPGLALEHLTYALGEDERPLADDERADLIALAERMEIGDRVRRDLALCPEP